MRPDTLRTTSWTSNDGTSASCWASAAATRAAARWVGGAVDSSTCRGRGGGERDTGTHATAGGFSTYPICPLGLGAAGRAHVRALRQLGRVAALARQLRRRAGLRRLGLDHELRHVPRLEPQRRRSDGRVEREGVARARRLGLDDVGRRHERGLRGVGRCGWSGRAKGRRGEGLEYLLWAGRG